MSLDKNMNKFAKVIQSRATRKNVKVKLPEVREVYQVVVSDLGNPTEEEMNIVLEKLLVTFGESEETAIIAQPKVVEITETTHPDVWETLEPEENAIASDQKDQEEEALAITNQASLEIEPIEEVNQSNQDGPEGALAKSEGYALQEIDKHSLIHQQAAALNVQLDTSQLTTVASHVADNYTSFEDACHQIKSVILMVLDQRFERASDVLDDTLLTIVNRAAGNFQSLNGRASQGFTALAQELNRVNTDFKSQSAGAVSDLKKYLLKT